MKPIDDPRTLARRQTKALLALKVALDATDQACFSRSMEALAISRELLAIPDYGPLRDRR